MIKTTARELKAFMRDDWKSWSAGRYYEDGVFEIDGNEIDENRSEINLQRVKDSAQAKILAGTVYNEDSDIVCALETLFKRWKKRQTHKTLVIEAPRDQIAAIKDFVKRVKGKIL